VIVKNFPVREFSEHRDEIRELFYSMKDDFDLIHVPCSKDCHQDHQVVYEEAVRVFKNSCILGYELPWNLVGGSVANYFVGITEKQLGIKISALRSYQSQQHRPYFQEHIIASIATVNGVKCGKPLAEAFELIRWVQ
jgi:LmbE family N-acetylglucosaminyl deacetylase